MYLGHQAAEIVRQTREHLEKLEAALAALVAGDFDNNGKGDLVVGVPEESIPDSTDCGAISVIGPVIIAWVLAGVSPCRPTRKALRMTTPTSTTIPLLTLFHGSSLNLKKIR